MPEMEILPQEAMLHSKLLDRLALCVIAELFAFELELESVPGKESGRYSCTGYILCCHRAGAPAFEVFFEKAGEVVSEVSTPRSRFQAC
jgi:hypothetical protein